MMINGFSLHFAGEEIYMYMGEVGAVTVGVSVRVMLDSRRSLFEHHL